MADPFRTSNPVLNAKAFRDVVATGEAMTWQGQGRGNSLFAPGGARKQ
jgi:hypothetical protein